jgi:hypothetical protein
VRLCFSRPNFFLSPGRMPSPAMGAFVEATGCSGTVENSDKGLAVGGSLQSAWGAPSPGAGSWLELSLVGDRRIREIRIVPGRNDSMTSFWEYGRPKTIRLTLPDTTTKTIHLADEPGLQRFPLSGTFGWVRLDIVDIYSGSKSNDTYISNIELGNTPAPEFDTFSNMIVGGAPPTTLAPLPSVEVSTPTSSNVATAGSTPSPGSTIPTNAGSTTSTASAAEGALVAPAVGGTHGAPVDRSGWPAFAGLGAALVGLGALVFLGRALHRRRREARS